MTEHGVGAQALTPERFGGMLGRTMSTRNLTSEALEFLVALRANPQFKARQDVLDVIFDALLFIDSSGQLYTFEDYRKHLVSDDPPMS